MKYTSTLPIFIGYEEREHEAYEVCKYSLEYQNQCRKETGTWAWDDYPDIIQLRSTEIKEYKRDHGEPQSTDFTFTRFWCPYLCDFEGFSLFVDCDFLFLAHPIEILKHIDTRKAVSVVQHPEYLPKGDIKMDGIAQHRSKRKNWASLIVFNNEHPSNKILEPDYLNNHLQVWTSIILLGWMTVRLVLYLWNGIVLINITTLKIQKQFITQKVVHGLVVNIFIQDMHKSG